MREKGNNVKNADLSHEDNNRKTVKKEKKNGEEDRGWPFLLGSKLCYHVMLFAGVAR